MPEFKSSQGKHMYASLRSQLITGFAGNAVIKIVNKILLLLVGIAMARILGPDDYGIYVFAISLVTLIGIPFQGGLQTLALRETAKYHHDEETKYIRGLITRSHQLLFLYIAIILIITASIIYYFPGDHVWHIGVVLWSLLLLPIDGLSALRSGVLRGFKKVVIADLPEQVVRPLVILIFISVAALLGVEVSPVDAMQYTLVGAAAGLALGVALLNKVLPHYVARSQTDYATRRWIKSLVPLVVFSALYISSNHITVVLTRILSDDKSVGIYHVAYQGAVLVSFVLTILNSVISPHVVKLYHSGEIDKLQKMLTSSARLSFLLSLLLVIVYWFAGEQLIVKLFGQNYIEAWSVLMILSLAQLVSVGSGSVGVVLNMLGHEKQTVRAGAFSLSINIALCFILIPEIGAEGAAFSFALSIVVWNVYLAVQVYRLTGLNCTGFRI